MKQTITKYGIIGTAIAVTSPQVVTANNNIEREFGSPRSIQEDPYKNLDPQLKLKLNQSNLPSDIWDDLGKLESMWEKVNTPSAYMRRFNNAEISHNAKQEISVTYEHKLMAALSDPNLRYMASEGDYYSLLSELTNRGVISGDASSEMSKNMMEVLANNKSVRDRASELFSTVSTPNDYQFLVKAVKNETRVVGGVAVVIVGVALVAGAVYVVAATGVYVATSAAFTVGGGGNCVNCHAPSNDYMVMKTFADEVGNTVLASKVFIKMKQDEAKAAIDASLSLGLISIKDTEYNNVINAMNRIIEENAGVGQ